MDDNILSNVVELARSSSGSAVPEAAEESRVFVKLRKELLRVTKAGRLRKLDGNVWRPIDGCPLSYVVAEEYKVFLNVTLNTFDEYHDDTVNHNKLLNYLARYNPDDMRDIVFDRTMLSFRDGVLLTVSNAPDGPLEMRFVRYDATEAMAVLEASGKVARHHLDHEYLPHVGSATPNFDRILTHQFPPDVVGILEVLLGRLLFPVGLHDNWQVVPWLVGASGTGKSIVQDTMAEMFSVSMTGSVGAVREKTFGMEGFYQKHVVFGHDLPHAMHGVVSQEMLQCMVSGDRISVPRKNKIAADVRWDVPFLFASRRLPDYADSNGQIVRRLAAFTFRRAVSEESDPLLRSRIVASEIPALVHRFVRAYVDAANEHRSQDFWRWCPKEMLEAQKEVGVASSYVRRFLALGPTDKESRVADAKGELTDVRVYTRREEDVFTSLAAIKSAFSEFMRAHHGTKKTAERINKATMELTGFTVVEKKNTCKACNRAVGGNGRCCPGYSSASRNQGIAVYGIVLVREIVDTSSVSERLFRAELQNRSGITFEFNVRPEWLKNPVTNKCMELDMYCKTRYLAIEYDGPHHYNFPNSVHKDNEEEFRAQQARDVAKDEICRHRGVRLIRVRCGEGIAEEVRWCMEEMAKP
jgi:hypothetical protein